MLPVTGERVTTGLEFVLDLRGPDSTQLLVDAPYNPWTRRPIAEARPPATMQVYQRPFVTRANAAGRWEPIEVISNRRRIGRDGTLYPERGRNWSALRFNALWLPPAAIGPVRPSCSASASAPCATS